MKKHNSGDIFSQNGMIWAEKEKKKLQCRIPFILDPGKKIPKKITKKFKKLKNLFLALFFANEIGRERQKKILDPNSVDTRHGKENSEKKSKKIQKIEKPLSGIIFRKNGMRQAKKEKKNFVLNSVPS